MHLSLVLGVHVIYEILHADENDIALSALDVLCLLIVCTIIFGRGCTRNASRLGLPPVKQTDIRYHAIERVAACKFLRWFSR